MRSPRLLFAMFLALAVTASVAPVCLAQTNAEEAPPATATAPPATQTTGRVGGVIERKPEVLYLRDAEGNLVPVPGFKWEDFARFFSLQQSEEGEVQPPAWLIDQIEVTGKVEGENAALAIRFLLSVQDTEWHRVPLRLPGAVLIEQAATDAELRLEPAPNGEGLLAWIKAAQAGAVQVELKMLRRLERSGAERQISLGLPSSAKTTFALEVPESAAKAELPEELGAVESAAIAEGTRLSGRLTTGELRLAWRTTQGEAAEQGILDATATLAVKADEDGLSTNAHLRVRSGGRPIDSFDVVLPQGATLAPVNDSGYTVSLVDSSETSERAMARVRLYEPNTVADVRLQCRQDWTSNERTLDLGGFAVQDAVRQRGHVALRVADELRAEWEERFLVRQVEELPSELGGEGLLAGFEYSGQPFSLIVRVTPRVTRVAIEPQYLVQVTDREQRLSARLRCRVRGGKLHQLRVNMAGWEIDEFGWANDTLVAVDDVSIDPQGTMTIPLARAAEGEVELRFQATRGLNAADGIAEFELPRPEATLVAPAQLVVLPGDNIRLTPRADAEMQLLAQRPDVTVSLPTSRQAPLFYRGEAAAARFVANYRVETTTLTAESVAGVSLKDGRLHVNQKVRYRADLGGVERLRLRIPRGVAPEDVRTKFAGDTGAALSFASSASADATALAELLLPSPRYGAFEIEIEYDVPYLKNLAQLDLPLVSPVVDRLDRCEVALNETLAVDLEVTDNYWRRSESPATSGAVWLAEGNPVSVRLQQRRRDESAPVVVDRAWTRTLLVNDVRQERVVWRVTAPRGVLEIRLPEGVLTRDVAVSVDKRALTPQFLPSGNMRVVWPKNLDNAVSHVMEIDFHVEGAAGELAANLVPVQLVTMGAIMQSEWEVQLPESIHLLDASVDYARAYTWRWEGWYFSRVCARTSAELERWSGGAPRDDSPTIANRYLFSTFGRPRPLTLWSASRSALVLLASAGTLLLGLFFLLVKGSRRPEVILTVAMLVVLGLALLGDRALLVLQCAVPGLLPLSVAILFERLNRRSRPLPPLLQGSTHSTARRPIPERGRGSSIAMTGSSVRITSALAGDDL